MDIGNNWNALETQIYKKGSDQGSSPFLIGVTGGTGAGKTTFARRLTKILATRQTVTFVDLESYYKDFSFLSLPEKQQVNFDDPESVDLVRFCEDLHRLRRRQPIIKPVYDLVTHTRHAGGPVLAPGDVVIIEGLMVFVDESVSCLFDLKIFIDTPAEIRLRRRLERDVREGSHTLAGAIDHYMSSVLPIHDRFIEPAKGVSSFVIPGWEDAENYLTEIVSAVRGSLNQSKNERFVSINTQNRNQHLSIEEHVPNQESPTT